MSYSPDGQQIASGSWDRTVKLWSVDSGFLQEDQSDSVFSIVEPIALAKDIDMGKVLVNEIKDSVVTDFILNTGTWKFRVDSIYFQGADATAFALVSGFPKYEVNAGMSEPAEFRFKPVRVGIHTAEIVIITQSDTLVQKIRGEGIQPQLEIVNNIIDFGAIFVGQNKDTLQVATIKNIGTSPLVITETKHNKPNDVDFTTLAGGGSFTLLPGETRTMDLRFTPSDVGRTSGTLEFYYNGVGSPAIVQLFGTGLFAGTAYAELMTTQLEGYPGDEIMVPIILNKEENLWLAGVRTIDVEMEFNPTLLAPKSLPIEIIDNYRAKVLIKNLPANRNAGEILGEIPFIVGLGNAEESDLILTNGKTNGGQAEITLLNGKFTLLGICREGGARLINSFAKVGIVNISPNPAEEKIEIEISLIESGRTELTIYNTMGEIVETIYQSDNPTRGTRIFTINTKELSTGQYFLQLRTPTYVENKLLIISK